MKCDHEVQNAGFSLLEVVLVMAMLVTIIGLAAVSAVRLQTRAAQRASDDVVARACALSAVELGLLHVEQDPNWRTT
jgi:Tfp pilus assembly protein PilX